LAKELTHRAEELKTLGWSTDEVARYAELWDYRQRWGAMNLEREDRLFLRKAEAALPVLVSGKAAMKKATHEKSYYRWICFHLEAMNAAEASFSMSEGSRGVWPILLEEEKRLLDYYEPVLGLPDTIKAKAFDAVREEMALQAAPLAEADGQTETYDFMAALKDLKVQENSKWRHLRTLEGDQPYPVLGAEAAASFRSEVRHRFGSLVRETLPSLAETEKPAPDDTWNQTTEMSS